MTNAKEGLKTIPAICRVLVEYERLYNRADARETWEILLNQIINKLPELGFVKLKKCPECGETELSIDGKHCLGCGYLRNKD